MPGRDVSEEDTSTSRDSFEKKIKDFLDGRSHGEDLFHALYDRVLDEPIPARMRALFKDESKARVACEKGIEGSAIHD
jgi:hypothetical protein